LKDIQGLFSKQFLAAVGTIEGGDDTPIKISLVGSSWNRSDRLLEKFGCKPDERALLVEWIPAGMQHTGPTPGKPAEEVGVDQSKIPRRKKWVIFPKSFEGLPVYYHRGYAQFATVNE
jgi:hypothetical protein